ncbi:glycosyltransferase family 9 protein [Alteromonas facilis]|uniref:glycosyltransferase family 9 protein n=1 Tax=Alteromonas facilis TaxID=2048004 RepID=UPI000C285306|nr:glycosyltransferase family 9 protein [Alteromonas facilis]
MTNIQQERPKILLIRMLGLGDVTCIGIPALRYVKQCNPDADIHFITFAAGKEVIQLAEPDVTVFGLEKGEWPDNIVYAMETFLGLAEKIVGEGYQQIINLDTWFMPCFLARFLKDAGEPVQGNIMGMSVADLITQFQAQTLKPEFVNEPAAYMQSTWFSMHRWNSLWWQSGLAPDGGYPEFYLKTCCGFNGLQLDMHIDVQADEKLIQIAKSKKVVALACDARTPERHYPYADEVKSMLQQQGVHVWTGFDGAVSMKQTLAMLKASDLLISVPSAPQWLATAVECPSLIITGQVDPRTLMPDYATDMSDVPVEPAVLVEGVLAILQESNDA